MIPPQEDQADERHFAAASVQSLRQGEVLGLKWADVDLDQGLLRIRSTRTPKTSGLLHPRSQPTRHRAFTLRCSESDALPLLNKCRSGLRLVDISGGY
jgi:integrase